MTEDVRDLYEMDHLGPVSKFLMAVAKAEALEMELAVKREELAAVRTQNAVLELELDALKQDYKEATREKP